MTNYAGKAEIMTRATFVVTVLALSSIGWAGDLVMINHMQVTDWGDEVRADGTWIVKNPAPDRLNPGVSRIECRKAYQGWQSKQGPECQEISASIFPVGKDFAPDLSFSYFAVQSWTTTEVTAFGTEGLCDIGYVLRIEFGKPKRETMGQFTYRSFPEAVVTKTKTGPLKTDGICGNIAKDYRPYTMVMMSGDEALRSGKIWWPF